MLRLRRDGVALAYEEAGCGAPPIMLVHDLGSDHTSLAPQFEHFRRGYRTVAVDLRGHGQSGGPEKDYTIAQLADDLAWLCYELGLYRPVVLGHGLGAMVALDLASRYPDLPAAIVAVVPTTFPSVVPPTLREHIAAPLLESLSTWDPDAAKARCAVPMLQVVLDPRDLALESPREFDLHLTVRLAGTTRRAGERTIHATISLLVDAFLSMKMARASPDREAE